MLLCWGHIYLQFLYLLLGLFLDNNVISLSLLPVFIVKSIFSETTIAILAFFSTYLHGIHSSILSLSVCISLDRSKSLLGSLHTVLFLHLATLCLLIVAFSSFTLKLIIDMYVLIAFLKLWGCFCSSFLFLSSFALFSYIWWLCLLLGLDSFFFFVCVSIYYRF